jgi:MFS family permease
MTSIIKTQRDPNRWMILVACITAVLMVSVDSNIFIWIDPALQKNLNASEGTIGLLSSTSTLMLAAFVLGGGALGDRYGRRRMILIGTGGTIAAGCLSIVAPNAEALIGIRMLDGISEALVSPLALAVLTVIFDEQERPQALGIYAAVLGLVGGSSSLAIEFLNQTFGWRSVFLLVIGLGLLTILLMLRFVPESKVGGRRPLDWVGILLCAAGLFSLLFGISQASNPAGIFSGAVLIPGVTGLVILGGFITWESRIASPVLNLSLFRKPAFSLGALLVLLFAFARTGALFHLSNYFQTVLKQSPIHSALMLLPLTFSLFVFSLLVHRWISRVSSRILIVIGTFSMSVGLLLFFWLIRPTATLWTLLLPMLLLGAGFSVANVPRLNEMLGSAPPALAGIASATNTAMLQLGNAMGIAVTIALATLFGRNAYHRELVKNGLTPEQMQQANELFNQLVRGKASSIASQYEIAHSNLEELVGDYQHALTIGISHLFLVMAIVLKLAAILAWFGLRAQRRARKTPTVVS